MGFFSDLLLKFLNEASELWATIFVELGGTVFFIEKMIGAVFSNEDISKIYLFVSSFAVSLILLKMLTKGFMTYVLWRDGDPDAPVQQTVVNLVFAVALVILFPTIYQWYADVSIWLIENLITNTFGTAENDKWIEGLLVQAAKNLALGIVAVIFLIMMFILYIQMIKRSAELLVLRLGFPLACMGLLDSDNGVFASVVKMFIQTSLTTTIQLFLMNLSIRLFISPNADASALFICIAFCGAAFGAPKLLQFIMLPQGGGAGAMQRVTSTAYTLNMVKGLLPK